MAETNRRGEGAVDSDFDDAFEDAAADTPVQSDKSRPKSGAPAKRDGKRTGKARKERGPGLIARFGRFVREVVAELRKVIWPTRKELTTYTIVVVVFVSIMLTVVGLLDYGFAKAMILVFGSK